MSIPHTLLATTGRRPSPAGNPVRVCSTPDESHLVARAWRMREVHLRAGNHMCGLCLTAWPCSPRTWAEETLRAAS